MRHTYLLIPALLFLSACKGIEGPPGPSGPPGTPPLGDVSGQVLLYADAFPIIQLPSYDSVQVSTAQTGATTAFSDSAGVWTLKSLPAGIYTFIFSKPGFLQFRLYGQQFVGGGTIYLQSIALVPIPNNTVNLLTATRLDTTAAFRFDGRLATPEYPRDAIIMLSATAPSSPNRFEYFYRFSAYNHADSSSFYGSVSLTYTFCRRYHLTPGMRVYAFAIPAPRYYANPLQPNPASNLYEFENTGVALSPIDTIIVP